MRLGRLGAFLAIGVVVSTGPLPGQTTGVAVLRPTRAGKEYYSGDAVLTTIKQDGTLGIVRSINPTAFTLGAGTYTVAWDVAADLGDPCTCVLSNTSNLRSRRSSVTRSTSPYRSNSATAAFASMLMRMKVPLGACTSA
jgi:hypothetical protein